MSDNQDEVKKWKEKADMWDRIPHMCKGGAVKLDGCPADKQLALLMSGLKKLIAEVEGDTRDT